MSALQRIGEIESRLERLELRVDTLGVEIRAEIRGSEEETRRQIREGDEETRRQMLEGDEETRRLLRESEDETRRLMRVLHEDVIDRIRMLGEQLATLPPSAGPSRPPRRRRSQ